MPIQDFNGNTFVAFTDISGFKLLMKNDIDALKSIKHFYQTGYNVLQQKEGIEGFFISDCGILFARNGTDNDKLKRLLEAIELINKEMLARDYMLTTSIAYGNFNYQGKLEFEGIEKNPIYGNAYVKAFLDNENGNPKIQPGQCRLVKENLPELNIEQIDRLIDQGDRSKHLYFFWNLNNSAEIEDFEREYKNSYNLKFSGMLKALKR
ncbi:MAG: hypothetical protein KDE33_03435 [Bacteroidetes bacterium]|nr:hypothetical protein [Bacteroidota bacterium]